MDNLAENYSLGSHEAKSLRIFDEPAPLTQAEVFLNFGSSLGTKNHL